jgi:4-aminobutyrate aminotransferase/(S)-3-amino-2-methylpropionate transaminase
LEVIKIFETENLLERSKAIGAQLKEGLKALESRFSSIGDVRTLGAMCAVEFVTDQTTKTPDAALAQKIIDAAREEGLLVIKCGVYRNVIRFLCPLVISEQDVAEALLMFGRALEAAHQ